MAVISKESHHHFQERGWMPTNYKLVFGWLIDWLFDWLEGHNLYFLKNIYIYKSDSIFFLFQNPNPKSKSNLGINLKVVFKRGRWYVINDEWWLMKKGLWFGTKGRKEGRRARVEVIDDDWITNALEMLSSLSFHWIAKHIPNIFQKYFKNIPNNINLMIYCLLL